MILSVVKGKAVRWYPSLSIPCGFSSIFFVLLTLFEINCKAQESENEDSFHRHHQFGLALSHAHVLEGVDENEKRSVLSLASWSVDYNFFFHPEWAIGLHTDFIIEEFKVKEVYGDRELIERSYPIAPAVVGIYKPTEHWGFLLGMGGEFAKQENFILTRIGIEYGTALSEGWEVAGSFGYDLKWDAYDTWTIGIGISKIFGTR